MDTTDQDISKKTTNKSIETDNCGKANNSLSNYQGNKNTRELSYDYFINHQYQNEPKKPLEAQMSRPRRMSHQRSDAVAHNLSAFLNWETEDQNVKSDSSSRKGISSSEITNDICQTPPENTYFDPTNTKHSSTSTPFTTPSNSLDFNTPNTSPNTTTTEKSKRSSFLSLNTAKNAMFKNFGYKSSSKDFGRLKSWTEGLFAPSERHQPYSLTHAPTQPMKLSHSRSVSHTEPFKVKSPTRRQTLYPSIALVPEPLIDLDVVSSVGSVRPSTTVSSAYSPHRKLSEFDKTFNTEIFHIFNDDSCNKNPKFTNLYQQVLEEEDEEKGHNANELNITSDRNERKNSQNSGLSSPLRLSPTQPISADDDLVHATSKLKRIHLKEDLSDFKRKQLNRTGAGTRSCPAIISLASEVQPNTTLNVYIDQNNDGMNEHDTTLMHHLSGYSLVDSYNEPETKPKPDELMISEEEKSTIKERNKRQGSGSFVFDWDSHSISPKTTRLTLSHSCLSNDNDKRIINSIEYQPKAETESECDTYFTPEVYHQYCFDPDLGQPGPVVRSSSYFGAKSDPDPQDVYLGEDNFTNELSFHNAYLESVISPQPQSPSVLSLDQEFHHDGNKHRRSFTKSIRNWTKSKV
ncbi:hypothetical protein NADFUDRAFT_39201 [Nadsonia fulvescens var. elongata DSM 6958]|uniref:Uncharacterized protein n=1 Tax=Nadsonia fulvescens var. elongata DSM 6958 TaxID=857566 RepID=A0A1E3PRA2_9ASCO|nr:hypothetical protein NADFUDRAFT_39201 [Nadsonia fulvescens var. elongata DSM 6958]